jgi:hypothetical protein
MFTFKEPEWANKEGAPRDGAGMLSRARDLASSYYPLGVQTGVHAMIEWCGVMGEHVKMMEDAFAQGIEPNNIDQHSGVTVKAKPYRVAYICEKIGCQLKPFIKADADLWKREINKWFE